MTREHDVQGEAVAAGWRRTLRPAALAVPLALALLVPAVGVAATPGHAPKAKRVRTKAALRLIGGSARKVSVCGVRRRAKVVRTGGSVVASVRIANRRRSKVRAARLARKRRARKRKVFLRIDRCQRGRWVRVAGKRLGRAPRRRRAVRHFRSRVAVSQPGALRIRAVVLRGRRRLARSKRAYVRGVAGVVSETQVSFRLVNRNRSRVQCSSDNRTYVVRGHLLGPRQALQRSGGSLTVYLHQIGLGGFYWHFKAVPGYDYAGDLARRGHVSLVLEQLGYDGSGRPDGTQVCYGSEADMASQIATKLRRGDYAVSAGTAPRFRRVALGAGAAAGLMTQPAAYSFRNVDALVVTGWADQGFSQRLTVAATEENVFCGNGGQRKDGKPGYVHTPLRDSDFQASYFADADPRVVRAARSMRAPGPCGEPQSALGTIAADQAALGEVRVPVLLVYGTKDPFFDDPRSAGAQQKGLYSGSSDVSLQFVGGAGNALALERSAPRFRDLVSRWLARRGY